jgi:hypothetical protein
MNIEINENRLTIYSKDLVDFEQLYGKVLFSKIEDRELPVKYCNEIQSDNNVLSPIVNRLVAGVKN